MGELEKLKDLYDTFPYFNFPLEKSPKDDSRSLYLHNMVTAFYHRDRKVISSEGKVILDAGCASGYKSLTLAEANPGAKIVGIDLSEKSVAFARERMKFHGFENAEFHAMSIEEVGKLGLQFDYINCDEVLYLVDDIADGLSAMRSVLKPDGIIRANLHSAIERINYFRAQEIWKTLGLMDRSPQAEECQMVRDIMENLKDNVFLKVLTWNQDPEHYDELLCANHLLVGDKGFKIPDLFDALRQSELEFISMVNWDEWNLENLFKNIDELPIDFMLKLSEMSAEEQLHLYELFHCGQRLLDFWCGHPQSTLSSSSVEEWTDRQWEEATVHLHPQLMTEKFRQGAIATIREKRAISLDRYLLISPNIKPLMDSTVTSSLFPLINAPHRFLSLVERWTSLHPVDPITWEATTPGTAMEELKKLLVRLNEMGYVLLES
ncbi:class I SAM-dependent methyltransferase [Roseofilum casamattae]|uniref:Class I SAM-dependent methyltransferase n=1 Tax=Roseofilum casamattae BLCC-M143 TaxID=3022442 RepID=A0ABT7BSN1_9CYAN|nr:class I SAM-dependent methyltransferase [Roseofilum casamattae]MDJ1182186.1 class I SAM-dependent methyltransferase [Roseofilum casamattae BLCC-M143]